MRTAKTSATVTKAQLADALLDSAGLEKHQALRFIEAFFTRIADSLGSGEEVKITGFGSFVTRAKAQRPGRNPRTGEPVPVSARRVVTFHASKKLKEQIHKMPAAAAGTGRKKARAADAATAAIAPVSPTASTSRPQKAKKSSG